MGVPRPREEADVPVDFDDDCPQSSERPTLPPAAATSHEELVRAFLGGDFEHTIAFAEAILAYDPTDGHAASYRDSAIIRLRGVLLARLGSGVRVPERLPSPMRTSALALEPRAAFLLERVDGVTSVDDLVDGSGLPELEALRTLVGLLDRGLLRLRSGRR